MSIFAPMTFIIIAIACGIAAAAGYIVREGLARKRVSSAEVRAKDLVERAAKKSEEVIFEAKQKAVGFLEETKKEERQRKSELAASEQRLSRREAFLDEKLNKLDRKEDEFNQRIEQVRTIKSEIERLKGEATTRLQEIAGLDTEKARALLLEQIEAQCTQDLMHKIQGLEQQGQERIEEWLKDKVFSILQRYAGSHASEITTSTLSLPSEDMKGKIIGREGRNIKTLERETGVEVLVDEAPGVITISAFDPIRRQIARAALERLISDGRIQPARIEEEVARARAEVDKLIKDTGEAAVYEVGVVGLDPRLVQLLGRLRFRTSFGQNVLLHSIEAAHIAGMLAAELGANVEVAKKAALLHDIGKAIDHEVEGTHVEIGRRVLEKFGVAREVIVAMQSHHEEYPYETLEAVIVKVAESLSAARPGARRDTVENYLKRLEALETITNSFPGVEKSYAIQAGREVRIFVNPEAMDDFRARELAREIALKIEEQLQYPGEIKVNVIRETRAIEYAR